MGDLKQKKVMHKLIVKHYGRQHAPNDAGERAGSITDSTGWDLEYERKKHCAELLREVQLWNAGEVFSSEMEDLPEKDRVTKEQAARVIRAMRLVAENRMCTDLPCRRGPDP